MPVYSFTPAAISYLTQFLLSLSISVFLIFFARWQRTKQLTLLLIFFTLITVFIGLLLLEAGLTPFYRLLAVYSQNYVLALALVFLIQFAYNFPRSYPQHRLEARATLFLSLAYFGWEFWFALNRYIALFSSDHVYFRPVYAGYFMAAVLLIAPVAFLRQTIATDSRDVSWWRKLWNPQGREARGARAFVGVFGILFLLGLMNVGLDYRLPPIFYYAAMSFGILIALWWFAINYINFIPVGISVQVKISVLSLTLFLALLGSTGWFIAPPYSAIFQPALQDRQTLRFTPAGAGGYTAEEVGFNFEEDLGEKLVLSVDDAQRFQKVDFPFSFLGTQYKELYIGNAGIISIGTNFSLPNLQAEHIHHPIIVPLLVDLDPQRAADSGGVFMRVDESNQRLIVTWYNVPALYFPSKRYTFQAVLYQNGVFEFTYNGLPAPYAYSADNAPQAMPWFRGFVSGQSGSIHAGGCSLPGSCLPGRQTVVQNYYWEFRQHLNQLMLPLATIIVGGSLILLIGLPLLLNYSINRPLKTLTRGVNAMEDGNLSIELTVQQNDEIGYLTSAFNKMAARLNMLVSDLENQVEKRTDELAQANEKLQKQLWEIEILQAELKEQAVRDPLTNAYNRRFFYEILSREIHKMEREAAPLSIIMIDIDHFKAVNDRYGHAAGDMVLVGLVRMIQQQIRRSDVLCRYGGEEFVLLLPGMGLQDAYRRAEVLRTACENMAFMDDDLTVQVTISIGVVTYQEDTPDMEKLLRKVDRAVYDAKNCGRNCTIVLE